jgi:hypothetical protein
LECPNPDCSKPDVQVEPDGRAVCQRCGFEVAKFVSDTNDENSSRNVLDDAGEKRQARLHATTEEERARLEIHEAENAPVRDPATLARANLPGHGAQPLRPTSAPALEQVRVGQVYSRHRQQPIWVPHMYGSQLILLPDYCSLPVKHQRKRKKTPMLPAPAPPRPPQPAPTKCRGFKQEKSTYRTSVQPRQGVRTVAGVGRSSPREKPDSRSAPS